jgi:O-antigen/teichoic acid export membrane protein
MEHGDVSITPKKFVRNSLMLISIEILAKALGVVFFAMVARFLGAKDLGIYAFSMAIANFVTLPTKFGFETIIQREVGRNPTNTYRYFWGIISIKFLISLASWSTLLFILLLFSKNNLTVMLLAAGFTLTYSFMEFTNAFFRANQKPEIEMIVRVIFSIGNLALGALVLYWGWHLTGVISAQVTAVVLSVSVGILILLHISTKIKLTWNRHLLWGYIVSAAPFAGILVALFLSNQTGIIILTPFAGKEDVGYFAAAFRLYDPVTLIPTAVMGAFLPMMSGFYIKSLGKFVRTLRFTLKYMFIIAMPLVVIISILAHQIVIFLYRESFSPSAQALQILSAVILFSFWNYTSESVLVACNRERILLKLTWITAIIHVSTNLIFIPLFSYRGACLAILTTQGIYSIMLYIIQVRRYQKMTLFLKSLIKPVLCASIMAIIVFLMRNQSLFISSALGLIIYIIMLVVVGAVNRSEIDFLYSKIKIT